MESRPLAILTAVLLVALLVLAASAGAASPSISRPLAPLAFATAAEEAEEAGDGEVEEGEEGEEEQDGEGEEDVGEECDPAEGECPEEEAAAEECPIAGAAATVSANARSGKVQVTIRYTSLHAVEVALEYRLGGKNGLGLGGARARFGHRGVFRDTVHLGRSRMAKVLAAHELTIGLGAIDTPAHCRRLLDERLTARRAGNGRLLWT
jgi:hypothetical protein